MPKLIDTNVMMAASAIHNELSALVEHASPFDVNLRNLIYQALKRFAQSGDCIVLDEQGLILNEYKNNMRFNAKMRSQEYGMLVLQNKWDKGQVTYVTIDVLEGNGERIGVISAELAGIVTDRADHMWIASAVAHNDKFNEFPTIVYGAESDWFPIENQLVLRGFLLERLLPTTWYQTRHSS